MELDNSLDSSFHGFPTPDFLGFGPSDQIDFDPLLASTAILGDNTPSCLKENTFDYSRESRPDIDLSNQSISSNGSDISSPDNIVMSASDSSPEIVAEPNHEEALLDLSPPFSVVEGDETNELVLIIKGSERGGNILVSKCHGHIFIKNRDLNSGNIKFRCTGNKYNGCYAQCEVRNPMVIMRENGDEPDTGVHVYTLKKNVDYWVDKKNPKHSQHSDNCPMIPGNREKILYINECKRLALNNLYDTVDARRIAREAKGVICSPSTVTTHFPSERNICKMINRVRQDHRARPPKKDGSNILDFQLDIEKLPEQVPRDFYRGDVCNQYEGKTFRHFIFMSKTQMHALRKSKCIIVDATFAIVQKPHYQLLTIHVSMKRPSNKTVNMPVAYALMQNKSQSSYEAVFQKIKEMIEEGGPSQVEMVMCDYERAIWNSLRAVWPTARVKGCWFHYCQAIYKRVKHEKLGNGFFNHIQVHKMARRLMTLALVDRNSIPLLFAELKRKYEPQINTSPGVKNLFNYFEKFWLHGTADGFGPKDYSCYRQHIRTTNIVESWNGEIFREGNKKKHNIYQLALLLATETAHCEAAINQYASKKYRQRRQVEKDENIRKAYDNYENSQDEPEERRWQLLEELREATDKNCRYTPRDLANVGEL